MIVRKPSPSFVKLPLPENEAWMFRKAPLFTPIVASDPLNVIGPVNALIPETLRTVPKTVSGSATVRLFCRLRVPPATKVPSLVELNAEAFNTINSPPSTNVMPE